MGNNYCIGIDISRYEVKDVRDDNGNIISIKDWWSPDKSKKQIDFVIQRTSYGIKKDVHQDLLYEETLKIPVRGAYHYFSTGLGWKYQFDNFMSCVKDRDYHFYAVDYETAYNNLDKTSCAEFFELVNQIKKETNKKVLTYFNPDIYKKYMQPYNTDRIINNYDNWVAQYPFALFLNLSKGPSLPKGVNTWKFWQYGGADVFGVPGYTEGKDYGSWRHGIDLNIFNGNLNDLKTWLEISNENPIPDPPDPRPDTKSRYTGTVLSSTTPYLNIRDYPKTGNILGLLNPNEEFEGDLIVPDSSGDDWIHITKPKLGYIASWLVKYTDNQNPNPPDPEPKTKPAIPGPFYILSHEEVGDGWFWPNGKLDSYPAVVSTRGGKGNVVLSGDIPKTTDIVPKNGFMKSIRDIMNLAQWKRTWLENEGWHNSGDIGNIKQVEFSHNLKWVTGINDNDGFYEYDVYYNNETPPDLNINYDKYRCGVMTVDYKDEHADTGHVINSDLNLPYISIANNRSEKLRIDPKYLKSTLSLPINAITKTPNSRLNVRKTASSNGEVITTLADNSTVSILELCKVDNKIWGKIGDNQWIALWLTNLNI